MANPGLNIYSNTLTVPLTGQPAVVNIPVPYQPGMAIRKIHIDTSVTVSTGAGGAAVFPAAGEWAVITDFEYLRTSSKPVKKADGAFLLDWAYRSSKPRLGVYQTPAAANASVAASTTNATYASSEDFYDHTRSMDKDVIHLELGPVSNVMASGAANVTSMSITLTIKVYYDAPVSNQDLILSKTGLGPTFTGDNNIVPYLKASFATSLIVLAGITESQINYVTSYENGTLVKPQESVAAIEAEESRTYVNGHRTGYLPLLGALKAPTYLNGTLQIYVNWNTSNVNYTVYQYGWGTTAT